MLFELVATGLDRAFLATLVRPALPRLSIHRSLRRLAVAEVRTQKDLPDSTLFLESLGPLQLPDASQSSGLCEKRITQVLSPIPIATTWGHTAGIGELTSIWRVRATPRPLLVLIGGWHMSPAIGAARLWPLRALDNAGFDVVIPCLPGKSRAPTAIRGFPCGDPCTNVIAAASLVNGLTQLIEHAQLRRHPSINVFATSLGAHLAALLATLPKARLIDRLVLEKPLGRLSDLVRWHSRGERTWCHHVAARLQRVYRCVDPLEREPTIEPERVTVLGATLDEVTPLVAAQEVADHFHVPLRPIEASHLFDPERSRRLLRLFTG